MELTDLNKEYDKLQIKYGAKDLNAIYNGGCTSNPNFCFVFMNPTGRNVASCKDWKGLRAPWIGTKNIWDLFIALDLIDQNIYDKIKESKVKDWTNDFAKEVYENITKHKVFITNLGKCTQIDARALKDKVYEQYLPLLKKEIAIVKPKIIILFGNQVSSIVLKEKVMVSQVRKKEFIRTIDKHKYPLYAVYYPIGNGRFNIDKTIEDIKWIQENVLVKEKIY